VATAFLLSHPASQICAKHSLVSYLIGVFVLKALYEFLKPRMGPLGRSDHSFDIKRNVACNPLRAPLDFSTAPDLGFVVFIKECEPRNIE